MSYTLHQQSMTVIASNPAVPAFFRLRKNAGTAGFKAMTVEY